MIALFIAAVQDLIIGDGAETQDNDAQGARWRCSRTEAEQTREETGFETRVWRQSKKEFGGETRRLLDWSSAVEGLGGEERSLRKECGDCLFITPLLRWKGKKIVVDCREWKRRRNMRETREDKDIGVNWNNKAGYELQWFSFSKKERYIGSLWEMRSSVEWSESSRSVGSWELQS